MRTINELTKDDIVIFNNEDGDCFDGNILFINNDKATVIYLRGLKSEYADVPIKNVLAYVDQKNGDYKENKKRKEVEHICLRKHQYQCPV